jgi:M6 family metalloprotease-like protein
MFLFVMLAISFVSAGSAQANVAQSVSAPAKPPVPHEEVNADLRGEAKGPQKLIVVLVEFPDKKHSTTIDKVRNTVFKDVDAFFREVSYGLTWIAGDITAKWYQVGTRLSTLDLERWNYKEEDMKKFEREAIRAADNDVDFRNYDFYVLVAPGGVWPHAHELEVETNDGLNSLRGLVVNEETKIGTYAHELGHLLPTQYEDGWGLPDLYSYEATEKGEDSSIWVGPWDLMDESNPPRQFSAWDKINFGWLTPEVAPVSQTQTFTVNLQPLEQNSGPRAVVIQLTASTSYLVEVRRRIGYDQVLPGEGVLIYVADLTKEGGYGVLRVIDAKPQTETLNDAPFKKGDIFEDKNNGVYVLVALTDGAGFTIIVSWNKNSDTDGDGLIDREEVGKYGTNPLDPDTDHDWLADAEEIRMGTDPLNPDSDNDGLKDGREIQLGTDPNKSDTDGDGLKDGEEVNRYGTNPLKSDTDDDGLLDGREIQFGTNPLKADTDDDGLPDGKEIQLGTYPLNPDTDNDLWRDGLDIAPTDSLIPNIFIVVAILAVALLAIRRRRGKRLPAAVRANQVRFCMNCGAALSVGANFCEICGDKN